MGVLRYSSRFVPSYRRFISFVVFFSSFRALAYSRLNSRDVMWRYLFYYKVGGEGVVVLSYSTRGPISVNVAGCDMLISFSFLFFLSEGKLASLCLSCNK